MLEIFVEATFDTIYMVLLSTIFAYVLGLPLGILTVITKSDGLRPNKIINKLCGVFINIGRSLPFIVLMIFIAPLTKLIVGTSLGSNAAIVPLVVASCFFVARMVENSLIEIDKGLIEIARCMGATTSQIIRKIYLVEAVPSIVRGAGITTITLVGYSAMSGIIGAGGLGHLAITYGHHQYNYKVMFLTVVILIILVQFIQIGFDVLANKIDKNK